MDKKKILIISRSFYPEISPRSIRTTALVKEFARKGHDVTLLTLKKDEVHIPFEKEYGITVKNLGPLRFPPISIKRSSGLFGLFKRAVRRALLLLFEYPDIELMFRVNQALRKEAGYDLLISIAVPYPIHWGVALARKPHHRIADVWVADCGDPYCGLENDSFKTLFYFSYIEKWFSRKADYITIPFEGARSAYFSEFHSKIKVIPQGLSFPKKIDRSLYPANRESVTFAYFGNIRSYRHYALPFLEKLKGIEQDFKFIIYTREPQLFEQVLDDKTLKKCEIRPYTDRNLLLEQLEGVDFLVHFPYLKDSQKSLKLIDYAYLGKPVLSYRNDVKSDQALREFLNRNYEHSTPLEDYHKYKVENVSAQFLELVLPNLQLAVI